MNRRRLSPPAWLLTLGQSVAAVGLLALLLWAVDGAAAVRSLAAADWRWLGLGWLALILQTLLSALRWQLTARQLGIRLSTRQAVAEYLLSQVVNQSLPGGVLGDAARAVRSRGPAGLLAAGQAVVLERLAGQIMLYVVLVLGLVATLAAPGSLAWPEGVLMPVVAVLIAGGCVPALLIVARRLPGRLGRGAQRLWRPLHRALLAPRVLPAQVLLSLGTTLCNLLAFALCARAVGVELGVGAIAALVPLVLFAMLIPLTVAGWGLREGAAVALLPMAGVTASAALAASVAFGLVFAASALPGLLVLALQRPHGDDALVR